MHEKANTSINAHLPKARNRVCMRKPALQSRRASLRGNAYVRESQHFNRDRFAEGEGTCMHEKGDTSIKAHAPRVRKGFCTRGTRFKYGAFARARKHICMRKLMHSLKAWKRVCTRKPTFQSTRSRPR